MLCVDAPPGDLCFLLERIQVLCYWCTLPQFCFSSKHCLICSSIYKCCITGGRSHRGCFFIKKHSLICFECIPVLCYGWTLPQELFVFFNKSCVNGGCSHRGVLFSSKHCLTFFSEYKSCVTVGRSRRGLCFLLKHLHIF